MQDFYQNKTSAFEGDFTMREGTSHRRYACTPDGATEVRIIPCIRDGVAEPLILSKEISTRSISDALIRVPVATFWGKARYAMIDPRPPEGAAKSPLQFFYDYIVDFAKNKPRTCPSNWRRWQGLKEEGDTQTPKRIISAPSFTLMAQGYLLMHKGETVTAKDGSPTLRGPIVISIKPSGAKSFLDQLLSPVDENAPWGDDNNKLGNLADIEKGQVLRISPYETMHNNMKQTWYKCEGADGVSIGFMPVYNDWKPWDQVLNLDMPIPEVLRRLSETFDATSVIDVFDTHPVYSRLIPDDVREARLREEALTVGVPVAGATAWGGGVVPANPVPPTARPAMRRPQVTAAAVEPTDEERNVMEVDVEDLGEDRLPFGDVDTNPKETIPVVERSKPSALDALRRRVVKPQ